MKKTWILIADAHRARCFERDDVDHSLTELAGFVFPKPSLASQAGGGDLTGEAGKGHGRTGHAGTQFEPHTEVHAKDRSSFALHLATYLNDAVAGQQCHALVLITTPPMLGELKPHLNHAANKVLKRCVTSDLTHYTGPELVERVNQALKLPD